MAFVNVSINFNDQRRQYIKIVDFPKLDNIYMTGTVVFWRVLTFIICSRCVIN